MILNHIALACSSEEGSDRFYRDLLGLTKVRSFVVPADLVKNIFDLDVECRVVDYGNEDLKFEIFLVGDTKPRKGFNHVCLDVKNREGLIKKCTEMGVEMVKLPKGTDDIYLFIRDFDGNLFEVKEGG
ncbi:MAG: VOC family protein [Halobacteriota archaeon]|nr:VOC family protein [Halobacteriota archaeon]